LLGVAASLGPHRASSRRWSERCTQQSGLGPEEEIAMETLSPVLGRRLSVLAEMPRHARGLSERATRFIDLFDRSFLISLEHRTDRRREAAVELGRIGLSLGSPKLELHLARRPPDRGSFQTIGERGCFESHLSVLKRARALGCEKTLVFEDDIGFRNNFEIEEPGLVAELARTEWDLVHFGYRPAQVADRSSTMQRLFPFSRDIIGATCYGVRGRILDRLIAYLEEIAARPPKHFAGGPMPVDGAYNVFRWQHADVKRFIGIPDIAYQRSSRSDIAVLPWFDRTQLVLELASGARSLKFALAARVLRGIRK
jgi:glycosyl transferase family 25